MASHLLLHSALEQHSPNKTMKPGARINGRKSVWASQDPVCQPGQEGRLPASKDRTAVLVQTILRAAQTHYQKQQVEAARDFLGLLDHLSAHTPETLETLGNCNFLLGQFEPAASAYRRALERGPDRAALWVRLALSSRALNDAGGLQGGLERALALEPENPDALKLLADTHLGRGNYRDAAMVYGKLIGRHPNQAEVFLLLAKCFFELGNRAASRAALEHVLEIEPGNQTALDNLRALGPQSTREGAVPAPARSQERTDARGGDGLPTAADQCVVRADAAYANGHLPAACEFIKQALRCAPRSVQLRVCLGNLQFQLGEYAEAFASYQQACESEPANADSWVRLAATALRVGRLEAFEEGLGRALKLEPENPDARRLLADTNYASGRFSDAAGQYSGLLDQAPNDPEVLLRMGNCRYHLDEFEAARQCFERVLDLNPKHDLARGNLEAVNGKLAAILPAAREPEAKPLLEVAC
jgi:tetratricopeptide (TPR) repeat protein